MPENTNPLLDAVTHQESAVFRAGQVARRLLSEHPHLTVTRATCSTFSHTDAWEAPYGKATLDLRADGLDGARAWALVLGVELKLGTREHSGSVYEYGDCEAEVDGVMVQVAGSRRLLDDEAAAWRAQQAGAADGGEG